MSTPIPYMEIFSENFFMASLAKNELMKRMAKAEKKELDDFAIVDEISMIDLESKKMKTVKHFLN